MTSPTVPVDRHRAHPTKHIGILLFDDVEELDAVGPWEILSNWTLTYPQDGWTVTLVSKDGRPVRAAKGMVLGAHHSFADVPPMSVLIHPGGPGARVLMRDEEHLAWVRGQRATVPLMTSVCSGALVYATAGVLAGRPATTHWQSLELLHELDPSIDVDPTPGSSTTGTSSPAPGSAPASTWRCTWSPGSPLPTGLVRCAVTCSTTRSRRSDRKCDITSLSERWGGTCCTGRTATGERSTTITRRGPGRAGTPGPPTSAAMDVPTLCCVLLTTCC